MIFKFKFKLQTSLQSLIDFVTINGLYAITLFIIALNLDVESRYYTIPLRLSVTVFMILLIVAKRYFPSRNAVIYLLFAWFILFYWSRILFEFKHVEIELHIPPYEYFLYTLVYCLIPFLYYSMSRSQIGTDATFLALLNSGIAFSILIVIVFIKIKMTYGYFDRYLTNVDPLTISYVGSLLIGTCSARLFFEKNYEMTKMLIAGILLGLCPLLIGGSRGPILALIIPIFTIIFIKSKFVIEKRSIVFVTISLIFLFASLIIFGDTSFTRLGNILNDLATGSQDVRRLIIWETAFNQFLQSPIWGDSIQIAGFDYPHNLILEVLMSTGIIGFVPFFSLMCFGIYKSFQIVRNSPQHYWLFVFFSQSLLMGMLSGNIYSSIWYWSSLGLIFSVNLHQNRKVKLSDY